MTRRSRQHATDKWIEELVKDHRQYAKLGIYWGNGDSLYFRNCRRQNMLRGITTIFTRDEGYHSSGWWKNPDYERCEHLSVSCFDPMTLEPAPLRPALMDKLVKAFFWGHRAWVWMEGPYSETGLKLGVHHFRLFCDPAWEPLKPRGEVYSRELTEAGWKSYSDVQAEVAETGKNPNRRNDS